jgi:Putative Actinobacterial Holin-X, holin superfamily III
VSATPPGRPGAEQPHNIAAAIAEVSERASLLVREEIELAKAEVSEKATKLIKGAIVGVAAGIFFIVALVFALVGCAWLLYYFLPGGDFTFFWGFFAMAAILVVLGVIAGLIAARAVKKGSPPIPSMAFEEARKIRETVSAPGTGQPAAYGPGASFAPASATDSGHAAAESPPLAPRESTLSGEGDPAADTEDPPLADAEPVDESAPPPEAEAESQPSAQETAQETVLHESVPSSDTDTTAQSPTIEGADSSRQAEHDTSSSTTEDEG